MCGDMNLREFYSYIATSLPSTALDPPFHDQPAYLEIYAGLSTKVLNEHIAEKYTYTLKKNILSGHYHSNTQGFY